MVASWDESIEETSNNEEHQEMTNLALIAIREESLEELDKVSDLLHMMNYMMLLKNYIMSG